jgi:hypothetical protein
LLISTLIYIASSFGNAKSKLHSTKAEKKLRNTMSKRTQQFDLGNLSFDYLQWASSTLYQETGLVSRQLGLISAGLGAGLKATFLDLC